MASSRALPDTIGGGFAFLTAEFTRLLGFGGSIFTSNLLRLDEGKPAGAPARTMITFALVFPQRCSARKPMLQRQDYEEGAVGMNSTAITRHF